MKFQFATKKFSNTSKKIFYISSKKKHNPNKKKKMCGICAVINVNDVEKKRYKIIEQSRRLRKRGPDSSGYYMDPTNKHMLCHERLAIMDPLKGQQPFTTNQGKKAIIVNGEIYNYKHIEEKVIKEKQQAFKMIKDFKSEEISLKSKSDCECLLHLFNLTDTNNVQEIIQSVIEIVGMFAFVYIDSERDICIIARDHIGIIPLYYGWSTHGQNDQNELWVTSELKGLYDVCTTMDEFPPGQVLISSLSKPEPKLFKWYQPLYISEKMSHLQTQMFIKYDKNELQTKLIETVKTHMMSDVDYGVLLSGGLDSSIIASTVSSVKWFQYREQQYKEQEKKNIHTFSIGLKDSPDLQCAQKMAHYLKTIHHEFHFTVEEGIDALAEVIQTIETYDLTTVRASVPMYLMARRIRAVCPNIKMVLSGEGSDELFGGYLYNHKAPNPEEFFNESVLKVTNLNKYDCLRANKTMAAWGIETRVPFLDKEFIHYVMSIDPVYKMCGENLPLRTNNLITSKEKKIEKHILREAFNDYGPQSIIWRSKEQFSDGVGYSWIDSLKKFADSQITDDEMKKAETMFPVNPPSTKEGCLYRKIFEQFYKNAVHCVPGGPSIACSSSNAIKWVKEWTFIADPSGRSVSI